MFTNSAVYAVAPGNPNRLIATDVWRNQMIQSWDGGQSWHADPALTSAVTGNGKYLFRGGMATHVRAIAFDPANACHVLVGTAQGGVFRSTDGGLTWKKIRGSE